MAYDEELAQLFRRDLAAETMRERKMFGGLVFLLAGNIVCGVYPGGGMFRITAADRDRALALPGAGPIRMGARTMGGMVALAPGAMADPATRAALLALALGHVRSLPPK